jgi:GTP-binding protein Era
VVINANIYVEKESQKGIIIGHKGATLKAVGTRARADVEGLLGARVFLELWVKVRKRWRDDKAALTELGFE